MRRYGPGLLLASSLLFPVLAAATTYHVAATGNDVNPGTSKAPLRTIQKAADLMVAGDTCIIHRGTYRETVRPAHNGETDKPITFEAAAGEQVTLTGTELVQEWSPYEKGIMKAALSWEPEAIFVNDQMMTPARYPNNTGPDLLHPTLAKMTVLAPEKPSDPKRPEKDAKIIAIDGLGQPTDAWKGAKIWLIAGNRWVSQTASIVASEGNKVTVGDKSSWWRMGDGKGFIFGVLSALDAPGEWHWQDGSLYYMPLDKQSHVWVEAKKRKFAFDLSQRSNIAVRGLRVFASSISMDEAQGCRIDNCQVYYPAGAITITGGFNRDRAVNINSEGLGIVMSGEGNAITNSTIAYSAGDGISIWGKNNLVENCIVHDCDYSGTDCAPICVTGDGHTIQWNTLYNGGRSIVVNRYLVEGRILHNHMYNAGLLTRDLGMVYTFTTDGMRKIKGPDGKDAYAPDARGTEIAYNWVHDNFADGWGCVGIYLDNGCQHHILHHNVVWNVSEAMAHNQPNKNNQIYNNTFDGYRASVGCARPDKGMHDGTIFKNNIFTGATGIAPPSDGATVVQENNVRAEASKLFINAAKHVYAKREDKPGADTGHRWKEVTAADYALAPGSSAIGAGQVVPGFAEAVNGQLPDCGAYVFGQPLWKAGAGMKDDAMKAAQTTHKKKPWYQRIFSW